MKLQILVPQYKETEDTIKYLLDSIEVQQNIDLKNDISVIIINDGTDIHLTRDFLNHYTYHIDYYLHEHKGVSATRNSCLDYATADYVMFCDADDMFYDVYGLDIIFNEIDNQQFDYLVSPFIEENYVIENKLNYIVHHYDFTFIHGKVYHRKFLVDNNIRWNESLSFHEDAYFNSLCRFISNRTIATQTPIYLWRWRDDSVSKEENFLLKTYPDVIRSNDLAVEQFISRNLSDAAIISVVATIYNAYYVFKAREWKTNQEYFVTTTKALKLYYIKYKDLFNNSSVELKEQIFSDVKQNLCPASVKTIVDVQKWIENI